MATPVTDPIAQCLSTGNGFGHSGSTSSRGACPPRPCAATFCDDSKAPPPAAIVSASAAAPRLTKRLPFIRILQNQRGSASKTAVRSPPTPRRRWAKRLARTVLFAPPFARPLAGESIRFFPGREGQEWRERRESSRSTEKRIMKKQKGQEIFFLPFLPLQPFPAFLRAYWPVPVGQAVPWSFLVTGARPL